MDGQTQPISLRSFLPPASVAFCLFMMVAVAPVLGEGFALFTATPLVLAGLRCGWRIAAIAGLLAMAGVTVVLGSTVAVVFGVHHVVAAVAMTELLRRRAPTTVVIGGCVVAMVAVGVLMLAVVLLQAQQDPFAFIAAEITRAIDQTIAVYREMGVQGEQIEALESFSGRFGKGVAALSPAILLSGALLGAAVNYLVVRRFMIRRGMAAQLHDADLGLWSAPRRSMSVAVGAGVALLLPVASLRLAAANVLLVMLLVFFMQGIAVAHFYLARIQAPRPVRTAGYLALVVMPLIVTAVGVFDHWFNFRRLSSGRA